MVSAVAGRVPDPIRYLGHGQLESASPATSVGHVALHEAHHLHEFREQAEREGRAVIAEDVEIQFAFVDGRLVAIAGRATAIMGPRGSAEEKDALAAVNGAEGASPSQGACPFCSEPPGDQHTHSIRFHGDRSAAPLAAGGKTDGGVEAELREVRQEKERLEAQGVSDSHPPSATRLQELERREAQLEIEHRELHRREALREAGLPEDAAAALFNAVLQSAQVAGRFATAQHGGGRGEGKNALFNLLA